MRAILIAHDRCDRDLTITRHPPLIVGFGKKGIHPLQYPFGGAADLSHPDRSAEDHYVMSENFLAKRRPCVTITFVGGDTGLDIEGRDTNGFAHSYIMLVEGFCQHCDHGIGRALLGVVRLERAIECQGFEGHRSSPWGSQQCLGVRRMRPPVCHGENS